MDFSIVFEPAGLCLLCNEPLTLLEAARQAGLGLRSSCGGKGSCGKCLVRVECDQVSALTGMERTQLMGAQLGEGWRLACRTVVGGNARVFIPPTSQIEGQVIQTGGVEPPASPVPAVRLLPVALTPPSLVDQRADLQRVAATVCEQYGIANLWAGLPALRHLREMLRTENWQVTLALRGSEIIGTFPGAHMLPVGLAVDVGTTKLACYLVDLASGCTLSTAGILNPQVAYGEDIMSRLEAAIADPARAMRLQQEVIETINGAAVALCAAQGLSVEHLLDFCLVGNTAMHHLLVGLPVRPLALSPFVPALSSPMDIEAYRLGLRAAPGARAHLPPPIAGFVGSDHLAFLLATGFGRDPCLRLGMDIGTNTEIALQCGRRIVSCSTASGPAFEGAHIRHGMRAAPGAIARVHIDEQGLPRCETIGGGGPVGICGSGILDVLADMRRAGLINMRGRLNEKAPGIHRGEDGALAFTLAVGRDGQDAIVITQHDIDQVLLAKGAIRAGIEMLAHEAGVALSDIEEIVIAGAFGTYLDPLNAMRIGLLPEVPLERVRTAGNAAGSGARLMLISTAAREESIDLARRIEYLELTVTPEFHRCFAQSMRLAP